MSKACIDADGRRGVDEHHKSDAWGRGCAYEMYAIVSVSHVLRIQFRRTLAHGSEMAYAIGAGF